MSDTIDRSERIEGVRARLREVAAQLEALRAELPVYRQGAERTVQRQVEAVLSDLLCLRDFLAHVGRQVEGGPLNAEAAKLALLAGEQVARLDRVIDALQEGLA